MWQTWKRALAKSTNQTRCWWWCHDSILTNIRFLDQLVPISKTSGKDTAVTGLDRIWLHMLQETPLETAAGFLGRRCMKYSLEKTLHNIQCSNQFQTQPGFEQNVLHWNNFNHLRFHVLWKLEKVLFQISKKKQSCKENVWATPAKSGTWQNTDWSLVAISPFYRFLYRGGVILSQIFPQGGPPQPTT